jgi:hypothetical protein
VDELLREEGDNREAPLGDAAAIAQCPGDIIDVEVPSSIGDECD